MIESVSDAMPLVLPRSVARSSERPSRVCHIEGDDPARFVKEAISDCQQQIEELRQRFDANASDTAESLRMLGGELARLSSQELEQRLQLENIVTEAREEARAEARCLLLPEASAPRADRCNGSKLATAGATALVDGLDELRRRLASQAREADARLAESLEELGRQLSRKVQDADAAAGETQASLDTRLEEQRRRISEISRTLEAHCRKAERDRGEIDETLRSAVARATKISSALLKDAQATAEETSQKAATACEQALDALRHDFALSIEHMAAETERRIKSVAADAKAASQEGSKLQAKHSEWRASLEDLVRRVERSADEAENPSSHAALELGVAEIRRDIERQQQSLTELCDRVVPSLRECHRAVEEERRSRHEVCQRLECHIRECGAKTMNIQEVVAELERRLTEGLDSFQDVVGERLETFIRCEVLRNSKEVSCLFRDRVQDLEVRIDALSRGSAPKPLMRAPRETPPFSVQPQSVDTPTVEPAPEEEAPSRATAAAAVPAVAAARSDGLTAASEFNSFDNSGTFLIGSAATQLGGRDVWMETEPAEYSAISVSSAPPLAPRGGSQDLRSLVDSLYASRRARRRSS
eukprot:TRINITY_DN27272_c0_g1_i1.p1 TRINITY_DN27272_c0_g1~~TRINITY_DN27272_c0_g1_i1.p1  ORF type:complete len:653 (-),score=130.09 TRINITY_DN27272_c0_g1_i1:235-2004(-)